MDTTTPTIIFVNHRTKECGVQQLGSRYYPYLERSQKYKTYYIDIDHGSEFQYWVDTLQPAAVIYNFYSGATMPWCSPQHVHSYKSRFKQLSIFHEVPIESMGFDLILHQDPSFEGKKGYERLTRPIPNYSNSNHTKNPEVPIFSSFGFGLGGKGFNHIVSYINEWYDNAIIRLHIPYAAFGDAHGTGARHWATLARSNISKPGIELQITHHFLPEQQLLDFLAESTANCFFYEDNYGRGISGTLDYALAVRKPIAITRSFQFKHVYSVDDSMCIDRNDLPTIVQNGIAPLEKFHEMWSADNLTACFERALDKCIVKRAQ